MASLETLPGEVSSQILSYLIRPLSCYPMQGNPRTMDLFVFLEDLPCDKVAVTDHPYYNLAATSRALRLAVEAYCQHLLHHHSHKKNLNFDIPTTNPSEWSEAVAGLPGKQSAAALAKSRRGCMAYRKLWVMKATFRRCIWCGKASRRRCNFDMFIWVCARCDKAQYGATISKTGAATKYKLKPIHYLAPQAVFPAWPHGNLTIGIHSIPGGVNATLLLLDEVKMVARYLTQHDANGAMTRAALARENKLREGGAIAMAAARDGREIQTCKAYLAKARVAKQQMQRQRNTNKEWVDKYPPQQLERDGWVQHAGSTPVHGVIADARPGGTELAPSLPRPTPAFSTSAATSTRNVALNATKQQGAVFLCAGGLAEGAREMEQDTDDSEDNGDFMDWVAVGGDDRASDDSEAE